MKNKYLLILSFFTILSVSGYSQSFKWVKNESIPITYNPELTSFPSITDNQGNVLLGSILNYKTNYGSKYYGDFSIKKYAHSGTQIMNKLISGKAAIDDIEADDDNNIFLSGSFMDTLKIDSANFIANTGSGLNINYFIIKLNPSGNFIWSKNITAVYGSNISLDDIQTNGNNLFAGIVTFTVSYIKKFDASGNETLSILQQPVRSISSIDIDQNGYIYAAGASSNGNISFGGLSATAPFSYNVYFVKYSPQGAGIWARFVQDITFSFPKIACGSDNNVYAGGDLFGSFMFGNIQAQGPQWVYDFFLTKIDSSGNFLWLREVPNNSGSPTGDAKSGKLENIALDGLNNVYFTGFQRGTVNWGNNVSTTSSGSNDIVILKYDTNGNILWGKSAGGTSNDRGDAVSTDLSGNVYISGNFGQTANFDTITVIGSGNINVYLAKISDNPPTSVKNENSASDYKLHQNYPNPFNPFTVISFAIQKNSNVSITIFDAGGKLVTTLLNKRLDAGDYKVNFNGSEYSSGIYFYTLETEGFKNTRKMMLIK